MGGGWRVLKIEGSDKYGEGIGKIYSNTGVCIPNKSFSIVIKVLSQSFQWGYHNH